MLKRLAVVFSYRLVDILILVQKGLLFLAGWVGVGLVSQIELDFPLFGSEHAFLKSSCYRKHLCLESLFLTVEAIVSDLLIELQQRRRVVVGRVAVKLAEGFTHFTKIDEFELVQVFVARRR